MNDQEYRQITEIMRDAESCARLTQWEEEFCSDMRGQLLTMKEGARVSDKQWVIVRRIEEKIYR